MDHWPARRTVGQAARLGVPIVAGAYVVLVVAGPMRPESTISHYALMSPALAVLDLAAGVGSIAVGSAVWLSGRFGVGLLAIVGGMTWFGANWAGDADVPTILRVAGMIAAILTLPVLIHLVLSAAGRMTSRARHLSVGVLYAAMTTLAIAWIAWYVPRFDPRCVELCDLQALTSLADHRVARQLADAWQWLTFASAVVLAGWAVIAALVASRRLLRQTWLLASAAAVGLAWAVWALALVQPSSLVPPTGPVLTVAFVARAVAILVLTVALGAWLLGFRRTLVALRGISERLSPFPGGGTLRSHLADAMGDPDLRLLFALPGDGSLVEPEGRPAETPARGSNVIPIEQGGNVVAVAVLTRQPSIDVTTRGLGPATRLAAANERLLAAVRRELLELRASRQRVVEAADAERHHLERDLHDGAQQSMVSLLYELERAREQAYAASDAVTAGRLARALDETDAAIEALRRIARGIHDPVLAEAGLLAALDALSIDAPVAVEFDLPAEVVCRPETASAAWRVVVDAVQQAARLGAAAVTGHVRTAEGTLTVALAVEGLAGPFDLLPLEDRVGAGGGLLTTRWDGPAILKLQVELPCA